MVENVYPGEDIDMTLNLKNSGDRAYTDLTATLSDGTPIASGVELAAGASFEQKIEWAPQEDAKIYVTVTGKDAAGEDISVTSSEVEVTTQDLSKALVLDVKTQAESTTIYSEPAVVRFAIVVENIGQTDAATLTVKEAGTTVATIPSRRTAEREWSPRWCPLPSR